MTNFEIEVKNLGQRNDKIDRALMELLEDMARQIDYLTQALQQLKNKK